ncbi:MAG TPA: hypothetical protein VN131_00350, partial [Mobilitalea sp.]|nr:hypothetical protein [Mobilitalea sp.]
MRKVYLLICIILSAAFMSACGSSKVNKGNMEVSPTQIPTVTLPAENSGTNVTQAPSDNGENVSLEDYYPIQPDTEYVYEGTGNEYATYQMFIDFIDHSVNRIQTRANNGGSETVRVIEVKNDKISIVRQVIECYYRDNLINKAAEAGKYEILLMKPLVKGTEWLLPDGRKRYIS